jgi:hypothetical protein
MDSCADAGLIIGRSRPNALIVGPAAAANVLLDTLRPSFKEPVGEFDCGQTPHVPNGASTVVVRQIHSLTFEGQRRLLQWTEAQAGQVQLITVSASPLFDLVRKGLFLERLYYRLNILTMFLPDVPAAPRPS